MRTIDDVRRYLALAGEAIEEVEAGTWVARLDPGQYPLVIRLEPPVLVFRVKVMKVPAAGRDAFFAKLLELNARHMVHGAYGLDGEDVVILDALEVENLDANEVLACVDGIAMAVAEHLPELARFVS